MAYFRTPISIAASASVPSAAVGAVASGVIWESAVAGEHIATSVDAARRGPTCK